MSQVEIPVAPASSSEIHNPKSAIRNLKNLKRFALLWLILAGGILRFSFLDKPPIWFDEAATYGRICGTYQQMLDSLQEAGFGPLHYSTYWWVRHGMPMWGKIENVRVPAFVLGNGFGRTKPGAGKDGKVDARDLVPSHPIIKSGNVWMTPFMLRLIPALCGTLMIPAMYWLTREITRRRDIALLAATLTTFSAYLLNYSRDAKMYMELWLFVTLNVACLLWWMRARTWTAWMTWIVTGTIMLGLQGLGAMALGIELVFVLVSIRVPRLRKPAELRWRPILYSLTRAAVYSALFAFLAGALVMSIGPLGYFVKFNQYAQRISEVGWHGTGVGWIDEYNRGRTGPELVRYATSAFFTSWEWPKHRDEIFISARANWWLKNGCFAMLALAGLALLPWRGLRQLPLTGILHRTPKRGFEVLLPGNAPDPEMAVASPSDVPMANVVVDRAPHPTPWKATFGVLTWIALPIYVFYLVSILKSDFARAWPRGWVLALISAFRAVQWLPYLLIGAALVAFLFAGKTWKSRAKHCAGFVVMLISIWLLLSGVYWIFASKTADEFMIKHLGPTSWKRHGGVWIPRYLGVVLPALFIVAATLIWRLPKYVRAIAVLLFVTINCCQYSARVFAGSEPPVDYMVKDSIAWHENEKYENNTKMYYSVQRPAMGAGLGPGTGVLGLPTSKYYWAINTKAESDPDDIRGFDMGMGNSPNFPRQQSASSVVSSIKNDVKRNAKLTTLIVWDSLRPEKVEAKDAVQAALGANWTRISDQTFYTREHWTWKNLMTVRRRVYTRTGNTPAEPAIAATKPVTKPATLPASMPATTQSSGR